MKNKLFLSIIILGVFAGNIWSQSSQKKLADIIIIPFVNETKKTEYKWLSRNIPDAVLESMREQFEFNLLPEERFNAGLKAIKRTGKDISRKTLSEKEIADLCSAADADIAIFGSYIFAEEIQSIKIKIFIFHRSAGKITAEYEETTQISGQIFDMADKTALQTVKHLKKVALSDSKKPEKESVEQKIVLEKVDLPKSRFLALGFSYKGFFNEHSDLEIPDLLGKEIIETELKLYNFGLTADMLFYNQHINLRLSAMFQTGDAVIFDPLYNDHIESQNMTGFRGIITAGYAPFVWDSFRPWLGLTLQYSNISFEIFDNLSGTNLYYFDLTQFYYGVLMGIDYSITEKFTLYIEGGISNTFGHGTTTHAGYEFSINIHDGPLGKLSPHMAAGVLYSFN